MGASFADKAKQLKPFVNFRISLKEVKAGTVDKKTRKLINDYHKILYGYKDKRGEYHSGYANGPVYPLRFKSEKQRQAARELTGQTKHKYLSIVFAETIQGKSGRLLKPKLKRKRDGSHVFVINNIEKGFEPLNPRRLIGDPDKEIDRALSNHPDAKGWAIQCGKARTAQRDSRRSVKDKVIRFMNSYGNWQKWLKGLIPFSFKGQKSFRDYKANLAKTRSKITKAANAKLRSNKRGKSEKKTRRH